MNRWSADLLEFESLREILRRFIGSPLGQARLDAVEPGSELLSIEKSLAETAEAMAYLDAVRESRAGGPARLRFHDLPDVRESAAKLRIEGVVLDGKELFDLGTVLVRAAEAKSALQERGGLLGARVGPIPQLEALVRELEGKLLPDGSVADDASPELRRLRRERARQKQAISESLERFVRDHKDDGVLQENFVTIRNDRFVVPVAAGQRRRVEGVIHGSSGTGQTLFMEPLETIELNNQLVRISDEEMQEVHRILRQLTATLRAAGPELPQTISILAELELVFGKADYAISFDCVIPRFRQDRPRRLIIRGARHPLLADLFRREKKTVVPVTIEMEEPVRTLLITGPNTGGKTVAMKTAGLLVLMAQAAIPVPCGAMELPLFEQVLADIGDNQSIAESLSSFSAHVRRLEEIVESVGRDSLVLLDELGRATDPEEGGALGVAVVDELRQTGAFTFASTHLTALKLFGTRTEGVLNAAMGFDEETLTPTYVLRTGVPGRSAGLAIASRLGLPPRLIARAQDAMSGHERDLARFLTELHSQLEQVEQHRKDLEAQRKSLADEEIALAERYEKKRRDLERQVSVLIDSLERRAEEAVQEVRASASARKAGDQAKVQAARAVRQMREQAQDVLKTATAPSRTPVLAEGVRIKLNGIREPARIRRMLGNGKIEVEVGFVKMQVPESDVVEVLPPQAARQKLPKNISFSQEPSWSLADREINVIGKTADEAREEIDRFLDRAALASVERVRIVHGHGYGVLRRAVAELLGTNPHIERFEAASQAEGGSGATIAYLRG